ncbi:4397966d-c4d4-447a-8cf9-270b160c24e1 [Thermothielavioides terrestris]|uniref:4397966d-c4d4-447a-8cf9-270b160c24e1 n=1 Tax=Thermothielavioides terrestris TaxID=2587410 RepID=A0A3S4F4U7_9PEZI|nr:4397966d-c4d4-447a-8cf9-270b160c24e1 [Thermothielavioides terrestris]
MALRGPLRSELAVPGVGEGLLVRQLGAEGSSQGQADASSVAATAGSYGSAPPPVAAPPAADPAVELEDPEPVAVPDCDASSPFRGMLWLAMMMGVLGRAVDGVVVVVVPNDGYYIVLRKRSRVSPATTTTTTPSTALPKTPIIMDVEVPGGRWGQRGSNSRLVRIHAGGGDGGRARPRPSIAATPVAAPPVAAAPVAAPVPPVVPAAPVAAPPLSD